MRISDWSSDVCSSDLSDDLRRSAHADRHGIAASAARPAWAGGARRPCRARQRANRGGRAIGPTPRSEEHTSELSSLMRPSYAVLSLQKTTATVTPPSPLAILPSTRIRLHRNTAYLHINQDNY